ncbi:MAG: hypothetical protein AB4042_01500 [Leptolyngbyaceae cyanobacterium]
MLQNLLVPFQRINEVKTPIIPDYTPEVLTHVTTVNWLGQADIQVRIYLPGLFDRQTSKTTTDAAAPKVQVKVGYGAWQDLHPWTHHSAYWALELSHITPGTPLRFRFCQAGKEWQAIAPLTALERVYETSYVPNLRYQWQHDPPRHTQGRVVMETTLEGLLAGYRSGVLAPRSREEMFRTPIALNMAKTNIPGLLSTWGIDELMITPTSSMADRAHLDPGFNYLTYDVADVDWQVGRSHDFMALVDEFHRYGLSIIPDLPIPHHVFKPFEGSLDQLRRPDNDESIYIDEVAQQFRNHGTWMFKLDDPDVRQQIVAKVVHFVKSFHLKTIRLSDLDGLVLQYAQRTLNYGAILVQELRTALKRQVPNLLVLGEATETVHHPVIETCIDIICNPAGFPMVEELCKPPALCDRPLFPQLDPIVQQVRQTADCPQPEAVYAQLHDEICSNDYASPTRTHVPWAHGQNPAQLAKARGEALVESGDLPQRELLNYVRRTVRAMEALTLFSSRLMYLFVPAVDSLSLGCLNADNNWKVQWEGITPQQLATWAATGLAEREIFLLHEQHRAEMVALRNIFRQFTSVEPDTSTPIIQIQVYHNDPTNSVIGLLRADPTKRDRTLLVIFNLGDNPFSGHPNHYELPVPDKHKGSWTLLFDGDWITPEHTTGHETVIGQAPGTQLHPAQGEFFQNRETLTLSLGARSLLVLQYSNLNLD